MKTLFQTGVKCGCLATASILFGFSWRGHAAGLVAAWGDDRYAQTTLVQGINNVKALAAGLSSSLALRADGTVVGWGNTNVAATTPPPGLSGIKAVASALNFSLGLKSDGTLATWGATTPVVFPPAGLSNVTAIAGGGLHNLVLKADGSVVAWGDDTGGTSEVPSGLSNVTAIAAGYYHNLALKADGTVAAWGDNTYGQTTVPAGLSNVIAVAAGGYHNLALMADGTVAAWGANSNGMSEVPAGLSNVVAIAAGFSHSLALRTDGTVVGWGDNSYGQTTPPPGLSHVRSIAAGWYHSLAIVDDGPVQIVQAPAGQMALWSSNATLSVAATGLEPISYQWFLNGAPLADTMAVLPQGAGTTSVTGTGTATLTFSNLQFSQSGAYSVLVSNSLGSVGVAPVSLTVYSPPIFTVDPIGATVRAGTNYTFSATVVGSQPVTYQWRFNGSIVPGANQTNLTVTNAQPGQSGAYLLWASNVYGAALSAPAGLTVTDSPPYILRQPGFQSAPVGGSATLSVEARGTTPLGYQWRFNGADIAGATNAALTLSGLRLDQGGYYSVLVSNALGEISSVKAQVSVLQVYVSTLGGQFAPTNVPASATNLVAVAAGVYHIVGLKADGTVVTWLNDIYGKSNPGLTNQPSGLGGISAVAAAGYFNLALGVNGTVSAWGSSGTPTNPPSGLTNVVAIAAGWGHSLALLADGTAVAWGNNDFAQTNVPAFGQKAVAIAAGYYHNVALLADRTVVSWGASNQPPANATNVVAIAAGWWHSLAVRADGSMIAWGDDSYGQCDVPAAATNVIGVAAGYYHSLALLADGTVLTWGKGAWNVTNVPSGLTNVAFVATGQDYNLALVIAGPPQFTSRLAATTAHLNGPACFHADFGGTCPLSCQWRHAGAPIPGATNRTLMLDRVQTTDAGIYTLEVVNGVGETNSLSAALTVDAAPEIGTLPPQALLVQGGVSLAPAVYGADAMNYQWQLNGTNLMDDDHFGGTTTGTLSLNSARYADAGTYSLVVANGYGSATGAVAQVSVSQILGWGDNTLGQIDVPPEATNIVAIASGGDHNLALRSDGTVLAWGDASWGQSRIPATATNVIAIADGYYHSLALRADGQVLAWGTNIYGYGVTNVPVSATNVVAISAGQASSLALRSDGTVLVWGDPWMTNVPASATNLIAIACGTLADFALNANGTLTRWGAAASALKEPASATNVAAIAQGLQHALALLTDGTVVCWGRNYAGQTNLPAGLTKAAAVAAGTEFSLAMLADGTLAAWGDTFSGQGGFPPLATNGTAISAGNEHGLILAGGALPQTQPSARTVNLGQSLLLTVGSAAGVSAQYQWQFNGQNIAGATNASFFLGRVLLGNAGAYRVTVRTSAATNTSAPISVSVNSSPLLFAAAPLGTDGSSNYFHLRLQGASGVSPVVVYASDDLIQWNPVFTNPPTTNLVDFSEPWAAGVTQRFYRAWESR